MPAVTEHACVATTYSPWVGLNVQIPAGSLAEAIKNPDAIQVAMQLGRLDFIASILACVAILLAVFGFMGFWALRPLVKKAAMAAAAEEVEETLPKLLEDACLEILKKKPDIITEAIRKDPSALTAMLVDAKDTFFGDVDEAEAEIIAGNVGEEAGNDVDR